MLDPALQEFLRSEKSWDLEYILSRFVFLHAVARADQLVRHPLAREANHVYIQKSLQPKFQAGLDMFDRPGLAIAFPTMNPLPDSSGLYTLGEDEKLLLLDGVQRVEVMRSLDKVVGVFKVLHPGTWMLFVQSDSFLTVFSRR